MACYISYVIGLFLMICSDLQKYYTIKYNPGLINKGFFKMTRNPNYLGEILIYNSFAIIVARMEFWVILAFAYTIIFGIRMLTKDYGLSKKKGWIEYDSYFLLPKFSTCWLDNYIIYFTFSAFLYAIYICGGILPFIQEVNSIIYNSNATNFCEKLHNSDLFYYGSIVKEFVTEKVSLFIK